MEPVTCNHAKQEATCGEGFSSFNHIINLSTEFNRFQMSLALHLKEIYKKNQNVIYSRTKIEANEQASVKDGRGSFFVSQQCCLLLLSFTLWTSTPVCTWGTAAAPAASSAISRCSACGNNGSTDPRPAGSRLQALYLQNKFDLTPRSQQLGTNFQVW